MHERESLKKIDEQRGREENLRFQTEVNQIVADQIKAKQEEQRKEKEVNIGFAKV